MTAQTYRRDGRPGRPLRWTPVDRLNDAAQRLRDRWRLPDMADAIVHDVPAGRSSAWNIAGVLFLAGDLYAAHRFAILGWALALLAGMVALTGVALVRIRRRVERDAERNIAIAWAAHRARGRAVVETEPEDVAA